MELSRNKLYFILFIACFAGYIWLFLNINNEDSKSKSLNVCFIKNTTNIPCPSCGSTRSIISLSKGHYLEALYFNPLGYLVALILLLSPIWILGDLIMKRKSLYYVYLKIENQLKRPIYAIPFFLFIIINWIWNITKEL
jgi:hypothetical protein